MFQSFRMAQRRKQRFQEKECLIVSCVIANGIKKHPGHSICAYQSMIVGRVKSYLNLMP